MYAANLEYYTRNRNFNRDLLFYKQRSLLSFCWSEHLSFLSICQTKLEQFKSLLRVIPIPTNIGSKGSHLKFLHVGRDDF